MNVSTKKRREPVVSEAAIQEACCDILALDDWRRINTDLKHLRGMGVQEPGMADDLFVRYWAGLGVRGPGVADHSDLLAEAQVMWIEWKRKGGKAGDHQTAWHILERKRGALVLVAGEDFAASIEGFKAWYRGSGLMRKRIIS